MRQVSQGPKRRGWNKKNFSIMQGRMGIEQEKTIRARQTLYLSTPPYPLLSLKTHKKFTINTPLRESYQKLKPAKVKAQAQPSHQNLSTRKEKKGGKQNPIKLKIPKTQNNNRFKFPLN